MSPGLRGYYCLLVAPPSSFTCSPSPWLSCRLLTWPIWHNPSLCTVRSWRWSWCVPFVEGTIHQQTPAEQMNFLFAVCWWILPAKNTAHQLHRQLLTVCGSTLVWGTLPLPLPSHNITLTIVMPNYIEPATCIISTSDATGVDYSKHFQITATICRHLQLQWKPEYWPEPLLLLQLLPGEPLLLLLLPAHPRHRLKHHNILSIYIY